jgi:hypothetical protein
MILKSNFNKYYFNKFLNTNIFKNNYYQLYFVCEGVLLLEGNDLIPESTEQFCYYNEILK